MPVIPHHHHADRNSICMQDVDSSSDLDLCYCTSTHCSHEQSKTDNTSCDTTCPTHIHAIKSSSDNYIQFQQVTLQLFNIQISEFAILCLSGNNDLETGQSVHYEKFYATPPTDIRNGRAPPFFNA